jgi:hypothetical protein
MVMLLLSAFQDASHAMLRQDAGAQAQQKLGEDPGCKLLYYGHPTRLHSDLGAIGVVRSPLLTRGQRLEMRYY